MYRVQRPETPPCALVPFMRAIVPQVCVMLGSRPHLCSTPRFSATISRPSAKRLQNRGVDLTAELEDLAALESRRRRLLPELEGLKREQNTAGDEVARAKRQGLDTTKIQEANRQRAQQIKQLEVELDHDRAAAQPRAAGHPQPAARVGAGGKERGRQPRGAAAPARRASSRSRRRRTGTSGRRSV